MNKLAYSVIRNMIYLFNVGMIKHQHNNLHIDYIYRWCFLGGDGLNQMMVTFVKYLL